MNALRCCRALVPVLLIALVITASGCGKSAAPTVPSSSRPTTELTPQASDDIAKHFAVTLSSQGGLPLDRLGHTTVGAVAEGRFTGLEMGRENVSDDGEFSYSFTVTFFDRLGNEQHSYDPETTARMRIVARARGRVTSAEHRAQVGVDRLLDVGGLLPSETTLEVDGAAHDTADCTFEARDGSETRRYHLLSQGALTDVLKLKNEAVNPYPLSGNARWDVAVDAFARDESGTSEARFEATIVVTFNGTKHPNIEINKRWRYRMDLDTGEVVRQPA